MIRVFCSGAPTVSAVVLLTTGVQRARAALEALVAQDVDLELFVVLNATDDDVRALVASEVRGARVLSCDVDAGVSVAWNAAIAAARAPSVLVVHEDARVRPGCLRSLVSTLESHPDAGAVGAVQVGRDGTVHTGGRVLWSDAHSSRMAPDVPALWPLPDEPFGVDYAGSACILVDRGVLAEVGGWDEDVFPAIYVDVTLGMRIWDAGWSVLGDPGARVEHDIGAMVRNGGGPWRGARMREFLGERNRAAFMARWAAVLATRPARADLHDADVVAPAEAAAALGGLAARRSEARAFARPRPRPPLAVADPVLAPSVLERSRQRRETLHDEFVAALIDREAALDAELQAAHHAYAALVVEHDLQAAAARRAEALVRSLAQDRAAES